MKLETGDILHCSSNGFIGRSIKWATKSPINHSALFIEVWGKPYIIDSQKDGTNLRPFDEWVKKYEYKYIVHRDITLSDEHKRNLSIKALSKSGNTAYDFAGLLIRQPIRLITGKWKYKGKKETDRMYCSEFVSWVHNISSSYRMTPKDLYIYCLSEGYFKQKYTNF